jgi:hypothetical protein
VTRVRKGLGFEEALKRWSPPGAYDEAEAWFSPMFEVQIVFAGDPPNPQEQAYFKLRRKLQRLLFDKLAEGDLLSSATEERPDPRNPRFLVHPAVYDDPSLSYSRFHDVIVGRNAQLWNVEVFEPCELPANVSKPSWLDGFLSHQPTEDATPAQEQAGAFRYDQAYAHVSIRGSEFSLNPVQAGIVRVLHVAFLNGHPWVPGEALRQEVGFKHPKLSGVFRHMKDPSWRDLIASDGRGAYRLKI